MDHRTIAHAIKATRQAQKLSRKAVATAANLSDTTVERLEAGRNVTFEAVCQIATVLGGELQYHPEALTEYNGAIVIPVAAMEPKAVAPHAIQSDQTPRFPLLAHQSAYENLRARFEDGERFDAMLNAIALTFTGKAAEIGAALVTLAQCPELPTSAKIRQLCANGAA